MTDQELNEKLLRFAGCFHNWKYDGIPWSIKCQTCGKVWLGSKWSTKHAPEWDDEQEAPNFLDPDWGIAYQVKWIWPKLREILSKQELSDFMFDWTNEWILYEANSAMYAAKAVEQLIDSQEIK